MRVFPVASVLFLGFSLFSGAASAVAVSELPVTIQSCITTGSCTVNLSSSYSSDKVSAFQIQDVSTLGTGFNDWLMRYELIPSSGQTNIDGVQTSAFNGYLWMRVKGRYSASEAAHPMTLFLDKVSPAPGSLFGQGGDLSYLMTTSDLVAGSAYNTTRYISYEPDGIVSEGGLSGDIPLCLAVGCQTSVQLNLVQLNYQSFGTGGVVMTGFDPSDIRGLTYSQSSSYVVGDPAMDYSVTQTFYISAVPEAEVSWMFGVGLMTLFLAVRGNAKRRIR